MGEGLCISGYPACLVSCLEEVLLRLLPEFGPGVMIGKDARELLEPVGEERFYCSSDLAMELMTFLQQDALVCRLMDQGMLEDVLELGVFCFSRISSVAVSLSRSLSSSHTASVTSLRRR